MPVATVRTAATRSSGGALSVVALCVVALALLAGCGGSGGSGVADPAKQAAAYRAQAQDVCRAGNVAIAKVGASLGEGEPTAAQLDAALARTAALLDQELEQLGHLKPPAELRAGVEEMLGTVRATLTRLQQQGGRALLSQDDPFAEANAQAKALGLDACAQ